MKRPAKQCSKAGCNAVIPATERYCYAHVNKRIGLRDTDRLKSLESQNKAFYKTHRWRKTSEDFRRENPLCEDCKAVGIITKAELVHHDPEVTELLAEGLDPCDWAYLHSICCKCHLKHLRQRAVKA